MSEAVLADAQFSVARVIKPDPSFLTNYQGRPSSTPICFPGTLDANAGKTGYDPNLLAGIPVPFGSKLILWFPSISRANDASILPAYEYQVLFRLRSIADFDKSRAAYHFPKQSPGVGAKFVVPAAKRVIYYEGPTTQQGSANQSRNVQRSTTRASFEALTFLTDVETTPLTPAGNVAAIQQGVSAVQSQATFNPIQFDCEGDEILIFVTRRPDIGIVGDDNWDFAGIDAGFAQTYGAQYPDLGIYLFSGSNP